MSLRFENSKCLWSGIIAFTIDCAFNKIVNCRNIHIIDMRRSTFQLQQNRCIQIKSQQRKKKKKKQK